MKNNKTVNNIALTAFAISLQVSSSLVMSARYDPLDLQQNRITETDQIAPFDNYLGNSSSILDSFQQEEVNKIKSNYIEVINLIKQNKPKEARNKLTILLKANPNEPEYYNLQGLLEILVKNTQAAQESYKKALEINPKNLMAHFSLAKLNLDSGDLDKASDYANKAINIDNKNIPTYLVLADIAYKQKKYTDVETILITALDKVKGDIKAEIEVINNLAKFYAAQKQPEKMLSISEDLNKRYSQNSQAMAVLVGAQLVNNKKDLAILTLRQLINQEKQDSDHRLSLAKLLSEQPNTEKEVIKLLDEATEIAPKKTEAIVFKTAYLVKLKRFQEAMEIANKAETLFPNLILGKLLKGDVYLAENKLDKALENYQLTYKAQPNDKVLFIIVDLLIAQKKIPEAISFLEKALEKYPKNGNIRFKFATVYQQLNDIAKAEYHYQTLLADQPENVRALNNLAWLYLQQNNSKALELAKKAYSKAPDSAEIADTYGYTLFKQGQHAEGLTILEKAANLEPSANDIQLHLAEAYAANLNKTKAVEILENIIKSEQKLPENKAAARSMLDNLKSN